MPPKISNKTNSSQDILISQISKQTKKTPKSIINYIQNIKENDKKKYTDIISKSSINNIKTKLIFSENKKYNLQTLKEETKKRLVAYTSQDNNGWLTLNYKKFDTKKSSLTHEMNIGLGDILLDPSIQTIQVQTKDGKIKIGHRKITSKYGVHFVDVNNKYLATFSGDKIKFIKPYTKPNINNNNKKEEIKKTNQELLKTKISIELKARKQYSKILINKKSNISIKKESKNKIVYKKTENINKLSKKDEQKELQKNKISEKIIKEAEIISLSKKPKKLNTIGELENFNDRLILITKKISKVTKVPISIILATLRFESDFRHQVKGDNGSAIGVGQFHKSTWNMVTKTSSYKKIIKIQFPNHTKPFKRGESIYADILGTAILLKLIAKNKNIDLTKKLTDADTVYLRAAYNAGQGNAKKYRIAFLKGNKNKLSKTEKENLKRYKRFVSMAKIFNKSDHIS